MPPIPRPSGKVTAAGRVPSLMLFCNHFCCSDQPVPRVTWTCCQSRIACGWSVACPPPAWSSCRLSLCHPTCPGHASCLSMTGTRSLLHLYVLCGHLHTSPPQPVSWNPAGSTGQLQNGGLCQQHSMHTNTFKLFYCHKINIAIKGSYCFLIFTTGSTQNINTYF